MSWDVGGLVPFIPFISCMQPNVVRENTLPLAMPVAETSVARAPLTDRITVIRTECFAILTDSQWMSLVVEFFGVASHICALTGNIASKFVPFLSIISSPFYLYHAIRDAKEDLHLILCAYKTWQCAEMLFWGGKSVGAIGTALSDIIKPFAGGVTIFGLSQIPFLGITFTWVIPILLIIMSTISGGTQIWSFFRIKNALHEFNLKADSVSSAEDIELILKYLKGPQLLGNDVEAMAQYQLAERNFSEHHFTSGSRKEELQQRIDTLLGIGNNSPEIKNIENALSKAVEQLGQSEGPSANSEEPLSYLQQIEALVKNADELLKVAQEQKNQDVITSLLESKHILDNLKKSFFNDGLDIVDRARSEIHRRLAEVSLSIFISAITLAAGILFLGFANMGTLGYVLALAASSLSIFCGLSHKGISQEKFLELERLLFKLFEAQKRRLGNDKFLQIEL